MRRGQRTLKGWRWSQWTAGWNWVLKTNDRLGKLHLQVGPGDMVPGDMVACRSWGMEPRSWLRLQREGSFPDAGAQGASRPGASTRDRASGGGGAPAPEGLHGSSSPPSLTEALSQRTDPLQAWAGRPHGRSRLILRLEDPRPAALCLCGCVHCPRR